MEGNGGTGEGALQRSLVVERQLVAAHHLVAPPAYLLALVATAADAAAHQVIVGIVDDDLGVLEQRQLLHTLLLQRAEVLLMGGTQRCHHTDGGLDNVAQGLHLARLADTSLKESDLCLLVEQPHRQRHANLRVVALGRACHHHVGRQYLVQPLLDHCLAVAASDAHHGDVELVTVTLGQPLEGSQRRWYDEEIGICK